MDVYEDGSYEECEPRDDPDPPLPDLPDRDEMDEFGLAPHPKPVTDEDYPDAELQQ